MDIISELLERQTKKIYTALKLREEEDEGEEVHLDVFLESLCTNLCGGLSLFKRLELDGDDRYTEVTTNICYLKDNKVPYKRYRRTILNSLSIMNALAEKYKGV